LWTYVRDERPFTGSRPPAALFFYSPDRKGEHPRTHLKDFRGVIHADLFPDNVFFQDDRVTGVIDFYFACDDLLAYDLAICLNAWCFEADFSFNITKGRAMLRSYEAVRPLSADERAALPVLCRGAAIRFLLTRLYDWVNTPEGAMVTRKDPMEYLRRIHFHR